MKPPPPKLSDLATPSPGETQHIDLHDVELSVAAVTAAREAAGERRTAPPPLPPEAFAPSASVQPSSAPGSASSPPGSHASHASHAPHASSQVPSAAAPAPAPPKSTAFYAIAILVCLVVGVGVGVVVAMSSLRRAPTPSGQSGANPHPAVITIPTVEVGDDVDGGR